MPLVHASDTPRSIPVKPLPIPVGPGTVPRPRANTDISPVNRHPNLPSDSQAAHSRNRSHSAMDTSLNHQRNVSSERNAPSPKLNIHPLPVMPEAPRLNHQRNASSERNALSPKLNTHPLPVVPETPRLSQLPDVLELLRPASPQSSTCTVRQLLAPPTQDIVSELLERARQCIHSVVLHLQQFGIPQVTEDEEIVEHLMSATITAIRDLLYVSGPSFRHLGRKSKNDRGDTDASQTPLIPAQRRAVATLSKFVLSARAVLNDGPWIAIDNVSQLSSDADELERSVVEFVSVAQEVRSQGVLGSKRLYGYLTASHADPTKAGAGTAGTWKGFGWVNIEDHEEAPRQNLTAATFNEFEIHISRVRDRLSTLTETLRATHPGI